MKEKLPTPPTDSDYDIGQISERPDGFYWLEPDTGREHGPFATMAEAIEDMEFNADNGSADDEMLREAEDALGITDWIDPETGELAEDSIHRLED